MVTKHATLVACLALLLLTACGPISHVEPSAFVSATSLDELVDKSEVVAIGTVERELGARNLARDVNDLTREDPRLQIVGQDYAIRVQSAFKGGVSGEVVVTLARARAAVGTTPRDDEDFLPLEVGQTYALFLRRLPYEPAVLALAIEPSRFRIDGTVSVESPWGEAEKYFPEESRVSFLARLASASR